MLFAQWLKRFADRILASRQRTGSFTRRGSTKGAARRTHAAAWMAASGSFGLGEGVESLEDRTLLAGVMPGLNVNISQLLGNQDNSAIAVNPLNSQQLFGKRPADHIGPMRHSGRQRLGSRLVRLAGSVVGRRRSTSRR